MNQPLLLTHQTTKKVNQKGTLLHRYFFQWSDRRTLGAIVLRVELFDADGKSLGEVSFRLPKTKVTSTITMEENGQKVKKPVYDTPVSVYVDDVATRQAVSFRYWVVENFFKKNGPFEGEIFKVWEDLSYI